MNHQDVEDPTHTGRTILTALYLCMLGVCFVVPIFFYFRMHCDDRHNRRLRDLEIAGITQAMNESQDLHREESRAARRKYREERRARIFQLFIPVRMILTEENFIRSETDSSSSSEGGIQKKKREEIIISNQETSMIEEILDDVESTDAAAAAAASDASDPKSSNSNTEGGGGGGGGYDEYKDDNDDAYILVPKPGLPDGASIYEFNSNLVAANKNQDINDLRKVPNECSICLCEYIVGSDLVYSSNPQCDHVFHAECIEQWIMKQRDGPLCPCCRRDFVIDPFDDVGPGGEKDDDIESCNNSGASDGDRIIASSSSSVQSQSALVQQQAESMSQIDESSASNISSEMPQQTTMTSPDNISSNHSSSTESINMNDDDEQHQDIMRDGVIPISITPTPILEISNIPDV